MRYESGRRAGGERADFVHWQRCQQRQRAFHRGVLDVDPVLVEVVGRRQLRVQPQRAAGRLAHLLARARREQGRYQAEGFLTLNPPDQVHTRQDVGPLVAASNLQDATVFPKEVQEVIGLEQAVVNLDKVQTLAALQSRAVGLGGQDFVDAEVAADIAQELQIAKFGQPVGVVDDRDVGLLAFEETIHLAADGPGVGGHALRTEQVAGLGPVGGITDQTSSAACQQHRVVTRLCQVGGQRQRDQVPGVEAWGGRIEPDVKRTRLVQGRTQAIRVRHRMDEPAVGKRLKEWSVHGDPSHEVASSPTPDGLVGQQAAHGRSKAREDEALTAYDRAPGSSGGSLRFDGDDPPSRWPQRGWPLRLGLPDWPPVAVVLVETLGQFIDCVWTLGIERRTADLDAHELTRLR